MIRFSSFFLLSGVLLAGTLLSMAPAEAQSHILHRPELSIMAGAVDYDLSGEGTAFGMSARVRRSISSHALLEWGGGITWPELQPEMNDRATLLLPEAQLQLAAPFGPLSVYVGAGVGVAVALASGRDTEWDPMISGAAGLTLPLDESVGLRTEMRVHGVGEDLSGTLTSLMAGFSYRY